jgi:drug/metabolite transporter (DMT)-like permease
LPFAALLLGNIALAFGPWFVRAADVGPVAAGFWRLALGVPMLFAILLVGRTRALDGTRGLWGVLILAGVAFAADLAAWHVGILHTTLANSTLFGNSATLMYPIWGFLVARAWPTRQQGLALALAAIGAGLLLGRSYELSPQNLFGDLLCLLAGALYTVYFILMARARTTMAPLPALAWSSLFGTLPLLIFAWALGERIWPDNWSVLLGLALASQVIGQGLMIYALGHLSPLVVGIALLTQPIVAGTVGWIVYDERLGVPDFVGAALVAVALVLVRRGKSPPGQVAPTGTGIKSGT